MAHGKNPCVKSITFSITIKFADNCYRTIQSNTNLKLINDATKLLEAILKFHMIVHVGSSLIIKHLQ